LRLVQVEKTLQKMSPEAEILVSTPSTKTIFSRRPVICFDGIKEGWFRDALELGSVHVREPGMLSPGPVISGGEIRRQRSMPAFARIDGSAVRINQRPLPEHGINTWSNIGFRRPRRIIENEVVRSFASLDVCCGRPETGRNPPEASGGIFVRFGTASIRRRTAGPGLAENGCRLRQSAKRQTASADIAKCEIRLGDFNSAGRGNVSRTARA